MLECVEDAAVKRIARTKISGEALRQLRSKLVLTQGEFAQQIGLGTDRVRQIEGAEEAGVFPKVLRGLAKLTGKSVEEVATLLAPPSILDNNVEPYSEVPVPEIPTFDMPIAAGPWMELADVEAFGQRQFSVDGRFRIHLRGDSMEKTWPDGSLVEFRCLRPDCGDGRNSKLEIGADYYIQKAEAATFKRLEHFNEEALTFRAVNKRKYPDKIVVLRADISRMAKAEYILTKPEK